MEHGIHITEWSTEQEYLFACIWFIWWMKSGCVACESWARFSLQPSVSFCWTPGRWYPHIADRLPPLKGMRALPFSMQEKKKAQTCLYTDDRESDSYGCNRLTNDDASWYVLLIGECLLRVVWSIKCWQTVKDANHKLTEQKIIYIFKCFALSDQLFKSQRYSGCSDLFQRKQHGFIHTHLRNWN